MLYEALHFGLPYQPCACSTPQLLLTLCEALRVTAVVLGLQLQERGNYPNSEYTNTRACIPKMPPSPLPSVSLDKADIAGLTQDRSLCMAQM